MGLDDPDPFLGYETSCSLKIGHAPMLDSYTMLQYVTIIQAIFNNWCCSMALLAFVLSCPSHQTIKQSCPTHLAMNNVLKLCFRLKPVCCLKVSMGNQ